MLRPDPASRCAGCGTELAPGLLTCPACHRLVHADELRRLASAAEGAAAAGDDAGARAAWRRALDLLPPGSRQYEAVASRVATLPDAVTPPDAPPAAATAASWAKRAGAVGVAALFLWKFKFLLGAVLSKGKLLLAGFANMGSVLSMILSLGVYWTAWGWTFALGLVLLIYVHEIGHVAALRSLGVPATAPMFIPGVGAFVSHAPLGSRRDEARVALAGPLWGLVGSAVVYGAYQMTGAPVLAGMAQWGARLNLFNLMPVPPLDGGTAFRSLTRGHRWLVVAALGLALYASGDGMLRLVLLVAAVRALFGEGAPEHDTGALAEILFLVAALTALSVVPVPVPTE